MSTKTAQVNTCYTAEDAEWLDAESQRLHVTKSEVVRRAVQHYKTHVEPKSAPAETPDAHEETPMPRTNRQWNSAPGRAKKSKYTAENPLVPSDRVVPPNTTCPVCLSTCWATGDGRPKIHLREAKPGDSGYMADLPTRVDCEGAQ